jgi:hypothetical protein
MPKQTKKQRIRIMVASSVYGFEDQFFLSKFFQILFPNFAELF